MRKIKTTKIGKKEYVEVDERIRLFWELHPTWSIVTEMVYNCEQEMVTIFKATVIDEKELRFERWRRVFYFASRMMKDGNSMLGRDDERGEFYVG